MSRSVPVFGPRRRSEVDTTFVQPGVYRHFKYGNLYEVFGVPGEVALIATPLVAAAILTVHKPTDRFVTKVVAGSSPGTVVLVGGGDPTLSTEGLITLAEKVHAAGIRQVTGRVRGDDSVFDRQRLGAAIRNIGAAVFP